MSDISALRARLAQEQARNRELRGYLMELGSGISNAQRELDNFTANVHNKLSDSNQRISSSHQNIIQAHEIQAQIDRLYEQFKHMELANKKIRECNNKRIYEFSNYATVRKIVRGMLDNLNLNLISDDIIYKAIEREHLQTPDYWLTAVLLSIMAWKNDDKALADRAMALALKLDKKSSAIFYMLFNLRMSRDEAALKWFALYQECELKGSDQHTFLMLFSLVSQTIQDNVNEEIQAEISEYINKVIQMNIQAEDFSNQDVINRIEAYLSRLKQANGLKLNMLQRCLQDYSEMADIISTAENNKNILQFVLDTANVSLAEKNTYIDQFINQEVSKPNQVELSVYEEIEYNELVIECHGIAEQADRIYEERKARQKNSLKLISEMIGWIYNRNAKEEVNGQIKKNMFQLTLDMQKQAIEQYATHYRARVKDIHPAVLGEYSTSIDFNNRGNESIKISQFYEGIKQQELAKVQYIIAIIGAVLGVLGIGGTIYMQSPAVLVVTLAGAGMAVYNVISNNMQKNHIMENCALSIKNKNEMMDQLFAEYETYKKLLAENDRYHPQILSALEEF